MFHSEILRDTETKGLDSTHFYALWRNALGPSETRFYFYHEPCFFKMDCKIKLPLGWGALAGGRPGTAGLMWTLAQWLRWMDTYRWGCPGWKVGAAIGGGVGGDAVPHRVRWGRNGGLGIRLCGWLHEGNVLFSKATPILMI